MSRSINPLTAAFAFLAAGAGLVPALADAAPVTLRYDFLALVTATTYSHDCHDAYFAGDGYDDCAQYEAYGQPTTYQGPGLGSRGTGSLTVSFDPEDAYGHLDGLYLLTSFPELFAPSEMKAITSYDPLSRAISLWGSNHYEQATISLDAASGLGTADFGYEPNGSGANFATVDLRLFGVTVTDLTEVAPVPLPATLPMLAAGLAGLGWLRRRRHS